MLIFLKYILGIPPILPEDNCIDEGIGREWAFSLIKWENFYLHKNIDELVAIRRRWIEFIRVSFNIIKQSYIIYIYFVQNTQEQPVEDEENAYRRKLKYVN